MKLLRKRHIVHEQRMMLLALAAGLPAVITCMIIIWFVDAYSPKVQWTLSVLIIGCWLGFAASVKENVANPLRTLANLLEAMREGDYSIRGREDRNEDALREVIEQVNAMSATLRTQRLGALEATTLLRKVMEVIDVAIFTFDEHHKLRLVNPAGAKILEQPIERLIGLEAEALGLDVFSPVRRSRPRRASSPPACAVGASAAPLFARAACPIPCWWWATSPVPCARRS